jgi:hypothetical protein
LTFRSVNRPLFVRTAIIVLVAALLLLLGAQAAASGTDQPAITAANPSLVQIPRLSVPPRLEDFDGMAPHGAALEMRQITGFLQRTPTDGAPATQRTDVYIGYDHANLYLVWLCFDNKPGLRAHLSRREKIFQDDYVEVLLDTFHDKRHAFVFDVNPLGVQAEALYTDGGSWDYSWDTVWNSRGRVTARGYMVWVSIPFKSLRFHPTTTRQQWGVVLYRYIARDDENDYWPRVSSRISTVLGQEGTWGGFEDISPTSNMQFNPYTTARSFRALDTRDSVNPKFDQKAFQGRIGLDAKFVFHDSLVLDATVNPDFSQVESDEPQNTINQRFEVFFPEKRPFFLENANFFTGPLDGNFGISRVLFTRRIGDPTAGTRLTGKIGHWDLGFFVTDDRNPGLIVPDNDPLYGKRAYFAVGRVSYEVGAQSSVGAIYTDREFNGDFNRVGGLDMKFRMGKNWTLFGRSLVSSTLDNTYGSGYLYGSDSEGVLLGVGRRFYEWLEYQDITPGFRTEAGFVPRVDQRRLLNYAHFYFRPEGKHLVMWGPEASVERIWDHNGTGLYYNVSTDIVFSLKRGTLFAPILGTQSDTLRPQDFSGLPSNRKFVENYGGLILRSAPFRQFSFDFTLIRSGAVTYVVPAGQLPVEGDETSINFNTTVRPVSRLQIDNTYIFDRVKHNDIGRSVYNNHILRTKWNYQFTRPLSFRFIAQYNGLLANPQYSSLQTTKNMNYDFLVTYLVHPGTAVYFGYNTNLENVAPGLCLRVAGTAQCDPSGPGLLRTPDGFINDGRQFFVKISYLFRK